MKTRLPLGALVLTLAACGGDLAPRLSPDGVLTAQVTGEVSRDYAGNGIYHVGVFEDSRPQFSVRSSTGTRGEPGVRETIVFQGVFEGVPEPGTYPFVARDPDNLPARPVAGFHGFYYWMAPEGQPGDVAQESYEAVDGHVRILASSADLIEGRFTMRAARTCRALRQGTVPGSCDWSLPGPDSPLATLTGSFSVVPFPHDDEFALDDSPES